MCQTFLAMHAVQLPFYFLIILCLCSGLHAEKSEEEEEPPELTDKEEQAGDTDNEEQDEKSESEKTEEEKSEEAAANNGEDLSNYPNPFDEAAENLELRRKISEFFQ